MIFKPMFKMLFTSTVFIILFQSCTDDQSNSRHPLELEEGSYLLSNGWKLSPAGREVDLGGLPLNVAIVPDGLYAVVTSNGYTDHFLALVDLEEEKIVDRELITRGWIGLDVSKENGLVYASAGGEDRILIYTIENQQLLKSGEISLPKGSYPTGITIPEEGKYLYVVGNHSSMLYQVDLETNKVASSWEVGITPYACSISSNSKTAYISNWGENSVSIIDLTQSGNENKILVKDHPNDLLLSKKEDYLYVASGNWNTVSVIDLSKNFVVEEIEVSLHPGAPAGSTPNALALSDDGRILYVANADNNCIALIDVSDSGNSNPIGYIPTGWYPTSVAISENGKKMIVANGKGSTSSPSGDKSNNLPGGNIREVLEGTVSFIDIPNNQELAEYSVQVYRNSPYENRNQFKPPFKLAEDCPIEYVFYIIKENRTYDQIFGDMEIGNGDPNYCYFPEEVTPNHHALAREFVLFDNFYHDAEVSMDGHFWVTAGYATDYVEKFWPGIYGRKGNPRLYVHDDSIAYPSSGFLWDRCAEYGITYRSYGEFARVWIPDGDEKYPSFDNLKNKRFSWSQEDYEKGMRIRPATPSLEGHYHPKYAGSDYIQGMSDSERFDIWLEEFKTFKEAGEMPKFTVLSLPGDHLLGTRPGVQTPRAMMAENDFILGKMVEEISNSPFWEKTAIFVIEDDPQAGPDHVDCHRTVALTISPYTRRGIVDSTMYSSSSMLRTMEEILGLPPLSQYDAYATPMWNAFQSKPNFKPYTALMNRIPLDELNTEKSYGAELSKELPIEQADVAPDDVYSKLLWHAIMGVDRSFPPRKRATFVIGIDRD
ncbi:MAG: phosphoesterase [Cyclobacteriaceae bacterium]|nr:MAG: phosphoesterase [Cyclobacteriaceae bacterium]